MKKTLLLFAAMLAMFTSYAQTLKLVPTTAAMNDASLGIGKVGSNVALTLTSEGVSGTITYSVSGAGGTVAADGSSFTPNAVGLSTITATAGSLTATANVYAYDTNLATKNLSAYSGEDATFKAANAVDGDPDTRWSSGTDPSEDKPAYLIVDLLARYTINAIDLFFENANPENFTIEFSTDGTTYSTGKTVTGLGKSKGGHYIYYTGLDKNTNVRFVKFNSTKASTPGWGVSIFEMGVYGSDRVADPTALSVTVDKSTGVATVKGDIFASNVSKINEADAMYIDLTNVTSVAASDLTSTSIQPKYVNALIGVKGTYTSAKGTPDDMYEPIKDTKNMVVKESAGYLHPVNKLQFVDSDPDTQPMWNGQGTTVSFISTGTPGYKITRSFKPNRFSTVYLPKPISSLPTGITVWDAKGYSDNSISFSQVNTIEANHPYVVCNSNSVSTDISWEGDGDVALANSNTINPVQIGSSSVNIQGCMSYITTAADDNPAKYVLQNSSYDGSGTGSVTIKKGEGVTITPFRAYFTGLTSNANAYFPIVTGINSTKVNADNNNRVAYTLSGQRVNAENLHAGLYIINGKKLIIK